MKVLAALFATLLGVCAAIPAEFRTLTPKNSNGGTNYAVLVAGSNTWGNYRHQSDVYHMYQILIKNGFTPSQIILMHFNDIANNTANPDKGIVINHPNGPNNYVNIPTEYTGNDVTAKNFLAIISGDSANATGRVLHTTSADNIYIDYSDHGATGLVAMPVGPYLMAPDLINTLLGMAKAQKFNQLTFYLEACESGSMFDGLLPSNVNIYATTASNPTESSYACYLDTRLNTYLGDLYSVNIYENVDAVGTKSETLEQQYVIVRDKTNLSHVMQYGDLDIDPEIIGKFMASGGGAQGPHPLIPGPDPNADAIDSRDVKLALLRLRASKSNSLADLEAVKAEEASRQQYVDSMMSIVSRVAGVNAVSSVMAGPKRVTQWDCYRDAIYEYEGACRKFDDYGLKWAFVLSNLCNAHSYPEIRAAIDAAC